MTVSPQIGMPAMGDAAALAATIALAFHGLQPSRCLVPDYALRQEVFPEVFELDVASTFEHGVALATGDNGAVALWMPHGTSADLAPAWDERIEVIAGPEIARRYYRFHSARREPAVP